MAPSTRKSALLLLALGLAGLGAASQDSQVVFSHNANTHHKVDPAILAALKEHKDPVDAWIALHPEEADKLAEKRLLRIAGEKEPQWMTEGDKMRLRRKGRKFADITDYEEFYKQNALSTQSGKARKKKSIAYFFFFFGICFDEIAANPPRPAQAFAAETSEAPVPSGLQGQYGACPEAHDELLYPLFWKCHWRTECSMAS